MDIFRFQSAQKYVSQLPLHKLSFCVHLWRAPLVEENQTEMLCSVTVPWDGKLFSPQEKLQMVRAATAARVLGTSGQSSAGNTSATTDVEMETIQSLMQGRADIIPDAATAAIELKQHLEKSASALYTYTSREDFICEAEEDCPVDPPQDPSPLATVILRQHRTQHQRSNKMYFMWATGGIKALNEASLIHMQWEGEERVVCIITADRSDVYFTAKPSLNETHTLLIDSLHVYSFKITVKATEETALTPSEPDDIIQHISKIAHSVKGHLFIPNLARRNALQRILLQQAVFLGKGEAALDVKEGTFPPRGDEDYPLGRRASKGGKVCYYIYGIIDRCIGMPEETLYLHCQWQHGGQHEEGAGGWDKDEEEQKLHEGFTTQLAYAGTVVVENFIPVPVHTFNTPFEYNFDEMDTVATTTTTLRLIVTMYSESMYMQQAPVGYTALTVPHTFPGRHSLRAPLWQPHKTGREFIRSALVGGAPALVDACDAGLPTGNGMSIKHGLVTEPSGELELTVMVMQQR